MFNNTTEPSHLDKVIDNLLTRLENSDPTSDEYAQIVDQLIKLNGMIPKKEHSVKPETLITVGANLFGILAILNFEKAGVVTSKALGFVLKSRI